MVADKAPAAVDQLERLLPVTVGISYIMIDTYDDFDYKNHCLCRRELLHQLGRGLPHSVGVLIPTERGRTPILVGSLCSWEELWFPRMTLGNWNDSERSLRT